MARGDRDGSRPAGAAARPRAPLESDRPAGRQDADDRRAHDRHRRIGAHLRRIGARARRGARCPGRDGGGQCQAVPRRRGVPGGARHAACDRAGGTGVLGPQPPLRPDQRHARGAERPDARGAPRPHGPGGATRHRRRRRGRSHARARGRRADPEPGGHRRDTRRARHAAPLAGELLPGAGTRRRDDRSRAPSSRRSRSAAAPSNAWPRSTR